MEIRPSGGILGASVTGVDLSAPLGERDFGTILGALGRHGVLCFPGQRLDAAALKAFSARFGALEVNAACMLANSVSPSGRPFRRGTSRA